MNAPTSSPAVDLVVEHIGELRLEAETLRYNAPDERNYRHQTADRLERLADALAALSTPAPAIGEEEAREVLLAVGKDDPRHANIYGDEGDRLFSAPEAIKAMLAFASLRSLGDEGRATLGASVPDRALLASLPEPVPVSAHSGDDPSRDWVRLPKPTLDDLSAIGEVAENGFLSEMGWAEIGRAVWDHITIDAEVTDWSSAIRGGFHRDSDEHRDGEDPKGLSGEAMPARARQGIAQMPDPQPEKRSSDT